MENNTALKMSATNIVEHFNKAYGNLDLLKVFMVTGVTDISKSYELISKLAKNAGSTAEKAKFNEALKILGDIAVKRVLVTNTFYSQIETEEIVAAEPEASVIVMFPRLEETLDRVRSALKKGNFSSDSYKEAMDILNSTVCEGKVIDSEGKPVTWNTDEVNIFLSAYEKAEKKVDTETDKVMFEAIFKQATALIDAGKTAEEVRDSLKELVSKKVVGGKDTANDVFIKDDGIFEDFYSRMMSAFVALGIKNRAAKKDSENAEKEIEIAVEKEIKPLLQTLEKDEKQMSFIAPIKALIAIYEKFGRVLSLKEGQDRITILAQTVAPKFFERHASATKLNVPIDKGAIVKTPSPVKEVYDDSHNIKESNPALWEEVKDYKLLDQLFKKGVELSVAGKWRDAVCMAIMLITAGQIKEKEDSAEPIKWDTDEVKLWYYNTVEIAVTEELEKNKAAKTIDTKAEIIPEGTEGPVPKQGFTQAKEDVVSKLLKKREELKAKYPFKFVTVPTDHYTNKTITFEVVDATVEQEPELLGTEHNLTTFINLQREALIKNPNGVKTVRKDLLSRLATCYEVTPSETKSIGGALLSQAHDIRKKNKEEKKKEIVDAKKAEDTYEASGTLDDISQDDEGTLYYNEIEIGGEVTEKKDGKEVPVSDGKWTLQDDANNDHVVITVGGKITEIDPEDSDDAPTPAEVKAKEEGKKSPLPAEASAASKDSPKPKEGEDAPAATIPTKSSATEASTNSNKSKTSYEDFYDILKTHTKADLHKAIYAKAITFSDPNEARKAIFDVIDKARYDKHWRKYQVRGYKNAPNADLHVMISTAIEQGAKLASGAANGSQLAG